MVISMTYGEIKNILMGIDDPAMKLEMVMDFGRQLKSVPENAICSEIVGCASYVEFCRTKDGFYARADSALVRGIVAIILAMIDGKSVTEIKNMDLKSEFDALNLTLGAGRLNGVNSMIRFLQNL